MKKRIVSLLSALAVAAGLLTPALAKTVTNEELVYENNFNQTFTGLDDNYAGPGIRKWGGWKLIPAYEGDGYAIAVDNSSNTRNINIITSSAALTTGTYKMTAKYMPSTATNQIYISASPNTSHTVTTIGALERKWYDLQIVVNLDKDTASMKISDGSTVVWEKNIGYTINLRDITIVQTKTGSGNWTADTTAVIDDLKLVKVTSEVYEIKDSDIKITSKSGDVETDLNAVNPALNSIEVSFGRDMKTDTINENTVKLTEGGNTVSCMYSYDNMVLTIAPQSNLKSNTEYTLTLSEDIQYANEVTLEAKEFTFTTKEIASGLEDVSDSVYANDFNQAFTGLDDNFAGPGIRKWGGWKLIPAYEGDGYAIAVDNSQPTRNINIITSSAALTTGTYKMTAKYMPSTQQNYIYISQVANSGQCKIAITSAEGFERKFYDLEVVVDLDKDKININITDGDTVVFTNTTSYNLGLRDITIVQTKTGNGNWTADTTAVLDNLVLNRVYTAAPSITSANFGIYASNILQEDLTNVSTLSDRVEIDLKQQMKAAVLSSENIFVTKKSDGSAVSCSPVYDKDTFKYVLFFDEPLTPEESYVVTVKNLENVSGYAMSETYNLNFKTGRAETKAALKQVTRNSEVITKASELVPGSDATVEIDYQNASGKAVTLHLIVVFYNGDEMLKANYITKDVPADVKMATYKVNYTLPSSGEVAGYDSVKVMLWDGFSTMKPLSESIYLTD